MSSSTRNRSTTAAAMPHRHHHADKPPALGPRPEAAMRNALVRAWLSARHSRFDGARQ